jgi:hypothetical protein
LARVLARGVVVVEKEEEQKWMMNTSRGRNDPFYDIRQLNV